MSILSTIRTFLSTRQNHLDDHMVLAHFNNEHPLDLDTHSYFQTQIDALESAPPGATGPIGPTGATGPIGVTGATGPAQTGAYAAGALGYVAGAYYGPAGAAISARPFAADELRLVPYLVRESKTFDRIAIETTTAGGAGMLYRLGIWNHNPVTGRAGTLILDGGTVVGDAVAGPQAATISQLLEPGWVWLGAAAQVHSGSPVLRAFTGGNPLISSAASGVSMSLLNSYVLGSISGAFGSLAGIAGGLWGTSTLAPCILLRSA